MSYSGWYRFLLLVSIVLSMAPVPSASQVSPESAQALILRGQELLSEGSAESAERALSLFQRSAQLARAAGSPQAEALALNASGTALSRLGRAREALSALAAAGELFGSVEDFRGVGTVLSNMGSSYIDLAEPDSALAVLRLALPMRVEARHTRGVGATLGQFGRAFRLLNEPDSAIAYYQQAMAVRASLGDRIGRAVASHEIGLLFQDLAQGDSATAYLSVAFTVFDESGDQLRSAQTLSSLGMLWVEGGEVELAMDSYREGLTRLGNGNAAVRATLLTRMGAAHALLGNPDSAVALISQGIAVHDSLGDPHSVAIATNDLGMAHFESGRLDAALESWNRALMAFQSLGDERQEATVLHNLGMHHEERGDLNAAVQHFTAALTLDRSEGNFRGQEVSLASLAEAHRLRGEIDLSVARYDSASAIGAVVRGRTLAGASRVAYDEQRIGVYRGWPLALLALETMPLRDRNAAALAAADRGRAQALSDFVGSNELQASLGADLALEGRALVRAAATGGATVLSYLATEDTLITWVARADQGIDVFRRSIGIDLLISTVTTAWRGMAPVQDLQDCTTAVSVSDQGSSTALAALAAVLVPEDVLDALGTAEELVIIPSGPLHMVPFGALPIPGPGSRLGLAYGIRQAPSLRVIASLQESAPRGISTGGIRDALVLGDPEMPPIDICGVQGFRSGPVEIVGEQARALAESIGSPFLSGSAASETTVRQRIATAPLVHLATHSYAYGWHRTDRDSWITLAADGRNDGLLRVSEILDSIELNADLVVLAGCETGLSSISAAEGTLGFQRALLAKGAANVLVSFWVVSEEATALLMASFYRHWLEDGLTKTEALRQAQIETRAIPGFEHPRHWAAFQLIGVGG